LGKTRLRFGIWLRGTSLLSQFLLSSRGTPPVPIDPLPPPPSERDSAPPSLCGYANPFFLSLSLSLRRSLQFERDNNTYKISTTAFAFRFSGFSLANLLMLRCEVKSQPRKEKEKK